MARASRFVDVLIPQTGRVERIGRKLAAEAGLTPIGEDVPEPQSRAGSPEPPADVTVDQQPALVDGGAPQSSGSTDPE